MTKRSSASGLSPTLPLDSGMPSHRCWENPSLFQLFAGNSVVFKPVIAPSSISSTVPAGSPSRGGDVAVYVFDINQPSLPTPFYSVLVSFSKALSTVFHSINSPDNPPFSHSVLLVLSLLYRSS